MTGLAILARSGLFSGNAPSTSHLVTKLFIGDYDARSVREKKADTFLDVLTLDQMRADTPDFDLG